MKGVKYAFIASPVEGSGMEAGDSGRNELATFPGWLLQ
jgi:hypothetical protein